MKTDAESRQGNEGDRDEDIQNRRGREECMIVGSAGFRGRRWRDLTEAIRSGSTSKSFNGRPPQNVGSCFPISLFLVPVFLTVAAAATKALSYVECHCRLGNRVAEGSKAYSNLCAAVLPASVCCCLSSSGIAATNSAFPSYR